MNIIELQLYGASNEDTNYEENNRIAKEILKKIKLLFPNIHIKETNDSALANLIKYYFKIIETNENYKIILDRILAQYKANKKLFILCMIQNLCMNSRFNTKRIKQKENSFEINLDQKKVLIQKANQVFSDPKYQTLWQKKLANQCFRRTYDFMKINPDYKAVLAYIPNYLAYGYYHAYLENESSLIDIARNIYFPKKEDGEYLLQGEILTKISLKEALQWEEFLLKNIQGYKESQYATLGVLSYYLDYQNELRLKSY